MDEYAARVDPLVVVRAEGARLFDADGRSYLDANSSWWVASLGHNHPRLVAALERQARENCHSALAGMTHAPAAELAEALCGVAPRRASPPGHQASPAGIGRLERVFFSDDGSTAVEVALKLARPVLGAERAARAHAASSRSTAPSTARRSARRRSAASRLFRRPFAGVLLECFFTCRLPAIPPSRWTRRSTLARGPARREADTIAASSSSRSCRAPRACGCYDPAYLRAAREAVRPPRRVPGRRRGLHRLRAHAARCGRASTRASSPDLLCTAKGFSGGHAADGRDARDRARLRRLPRRSRARLLLRALVLRQPARRGGRARSAARLRRGARARARATEGGAHRRRVLEARLRCPASRARARSA